MATPCIRTCRFPVAWRCSADIRSLKDLLYYILGCKQMEDPNRMPFGFIPLTTGQIFYMSTYCYCTVNLKPFVPGHILVLSRRPVLSVDQLTDVESANLMQTVARAMRMLKKYYHTDSVTVAIQDGKPAGMTIPHLHVHLMPRRENDAVAGDVVYSELERADFFKWYQNLQAPCSGVSFV